jgi:glycosyltransferase involved in cell wall biosynthesis
VKGGGGAHRLRVVFICQAVDLDDPIQPTTVRWIEELAANSRVERVMVLALRVGRYELPENVEVRQFGRSRRLATANAFLTGVARLVRARPDFFFVYQGGHYPPMLMPFKLALRIPIIQWKAHPIITPAMARHARWCDDLIFTSARAAFPMDLDKVRVVGQGVDTNRFRIEERSSLGDLIAVGRIAPIKGVHQMIEAVACANRTYGTQHKLNVYGPTMAADAAYEAEAEALIERLGASDSVALHGPVGQDRLPDLLNAHQASLNFSAGAIDKTAVEAMACGLPVVSTNEAIIEVLPPDLQAILVPDRQSTDDQARVIHELLDRPDAEIEQLGERVRALAVADHSIDRLFDRILDEVETLLWARR